MLYNKDWDKPEIKADPSLESLIAWLKKMPADQAYDYENCEGECLFGLYMASIGHEWFAKVRGFQMRDNFGERGVEFKRAVYAHIARSEPWTFGAALTRAREALASRA